MRLKHESLKYLGLEETRFARKKSNSHSFENRYKFRHKTAYRLSFHNHLHLMNDSLLWVYERLPTAYPQPLSSFVSHG